MYVYVHVHVSENESYCLALYLLGPMGMRPHMVLYDSLE